MNINTYINRIFDIKSEKEFDSLQNFAYSYQKKKNTVYNRYEDLVKQSSLRNSLITETPCFLPIRFFKTKKVITGNLESSIVFRSSGTSKQKPSEHHIVDIKLYEKTLISGFKQFYGLPSDYIFLALLPGYLERKDASLVYMLKTLMSESNSPYNGFFLEDLCSMYDTILQLEHDCKKYMVFGVSHALLNFANKFKLNIKHGTIVETGGMKGQGKEIVRESLHKELTESLGVKSIDSEYGMTELLSQAYSKTNGRYYCPPWMKVMIREPNDPFSISKSGSGALNIIDLANINSCCFIETDDLATVYPDGGFEITGRFDFSELRGCNLMV